MPKQATAEEIRKVEEVSLPEETLRADMPMVRCRVVYLGASRSKSITLVGSIHIENIEDPDGPVEREIDGEKRRFMQIRTATASGTTCYDFSTHDTRGRIIKQRLMPDSATERLRGKPFIWCEHIEHLREFFLGLRDSDTGKRVKEFEVMAKPEEMTVVRDFIRRSERGRRMQEALFADISGG